MANLKKLNLGVIGLSPGNGHPYSWSAIFNGFNSEAMAKCPFPVIPEYLSKQKFPEDYLFDDAQVTHVWTQNREISQDIALSAHISHIVNDINDLIGNVDAILLARDDAEQHFSMAHPFITSGIPIFIDKPFALTYQEAETMLSLQQMNHQIFTCSSLRFADELILTTKDWEQLGELISVEASVMKNWKTYGVHLLDPIIYNAKDRGELLDVKSYHENGINIIKIKWSQLTAQLNITGDSPAPLAFKYFGTKGVVEKKFHDSFSCFKKSLKHFVLQIRTGEIQIPRSETLEVVKILEWGNL